MNKYTITILLPLIFLIQISFGQSSDSLDTKSNQNIEQRLLNLAKIDSSLNKKVTISVADIPITEFIRGIAKSSGVNISIDPKVTLTIINSFNNVRVVDVLIFLKRQYNLELSVVGNIIVIGLQKEIELNPKCEIQYDIITKLLSLDIQNAPLGEVLKGITQKTSKNITAQSSLLNYKIIAFALDLPFESAIDQIASSNDLEINSTETGIVFLKKRVPVEKPEIKAQLGKLTDKKPANLTYKLSCELIGQDSLWLFAENAPIVEVIKELSFQSHNSYIITSPPDGEISVQLNGHSYHKALKSVLNSTDHVFKLQDNIYLIGKNDSPDLMKQELVHLQYRTVDSILHIVPSDLLNGIESKTFREQNSIMLSGPADQVDQTIDFITLIDKLVPVISIEVIIIDYNKSFTISTGVQAGLLPEGESVQTTGQVLPSVDMTVNSQTINDLIARFNGFGWAKIGNVAPNFYMTLQAMENQGILSIRSTPILSTLNGHKAELSIGDTEYYLEEQINIIGTQNPQSQKIQIYKPVEAELSVYITPIVSGDDQITLEIEVNQSDFTERISTTAPPGSVKRTFKSQIRVKNEEMILLGGLEENRNSKTSSGVPWLSKIPILKWFFSSRTEEKSKSKLNIFIRATIIS